MILQFVLEGHVHLSIQEEIRVGHEVRPAILESSSRFKFGQVVLGEAVEVGSLVASHHQEPPPPEVLQFRNARIVMHERAPVVNAVHLHGVPEPRHDTFEHQPHEISVADQDARPPPPSARLEFEAIDLVALLGMGDARVEDVPMIVGAGRRLGELRVEVLAQPKVELGRARLREGSRFRAGSVRIPPRVIVVRVEPVEGERGGG
mmetsp:Transcript_48374/g.146091  ORF Transcript_48374/g.146091 Transcript_48374/m.146091 type:complete len:205 (+) Transcript_48374:586-1200(+)